MHTSNKAAAGTTASLQLVGDQGSGTEGSAVGLLTAVRRQQAML